MAEQTIFQDQEELERLAVQSRVLRPYEEPLLETIFAGRRGLRVLDVGCNSGYKTFALFDRPEIDRVVGLELHEELAQNAQRRFGGEKFTFFSCDVDSPELPRRLTRVMAEAGIGKFDVIYLSFLLMHLKDPAGLLTALRPFLATEGSLVSVECNDQEAYLKPDEGDLMGQFLDILSQSPFSGKRNMGGEVPGLLKECGYRDIVISSRLVTAQGEQRREKEDICETFCSMVFQDVEILRRQAPDDPQYAAWGEWMDAHYQELRRRILDPRSRVAEGVMMIRCRG